MDGAERLQEMQEVLSDRSWSWRTMPLLCQGEADRHFLHPRPRGNVKSARQGLIVRRQGYRDLPTRLAIEIIKGIEPTIDAGEGGRIHIDRVHTLEL